MRKISDILKNPTLSEIVELKKVSTGVWDNQRIFVDGFFPASIQNFFQDCGEDKMPAKPEYFESIRYPMASFWNLMPEMIKKIPYSDPNKYFPNGKPRRGTFLDIGSCNGEKVFTASLFFKKSMGIEVSEKSFGIAATNLNKFKNIELFNCDAFDHPEILSRADVIYMYSPIRDHELMVKLGTFAVNNLKIGATLCEVRPVWVGNWFAELARFNDVRDFATVALKDSGGEFQGNVFITRITENLFKLENLKKSESRTQSESIFLTIKK